MATVTITDDSTTTKCSHPIGGFSHRQRNIGKSGSQRLSFPEREEMRWKGITSAQSSANIFHLCGHLQLQATTYEQMKQKFLYWPHKISEDIWNRREVIDPTQFISYCCMCNSCSLWLTQPLLLQYRTIKLWNWCPPLDGNGQRKWSVICLWSSDRWHLKKWPWSCPLESLSFSAGDSNKKMKAISVIDSVWWMCQ